MDNKFLIWFLLESKFKPKEYVNIKNNKGERALDIAIAFYIKYAFCKKESLLLLKDQWRQIIEKLLKQGADWSLSNGTLTPMHFALQNRLTSLVRLFVSELLYKKIDVKKKLLIIDEHSEISLGRLLCNCDPKMRNLILSFLD